MSQKKLTLGQKAADLLNSLVGSWWFVGLILFYIAVWILLNTHITHFGVWDPFPYIVLNLTLSSIAALHASIILMSQNRRAEIDAERIANDYLVDKRTEKEIKTLQLDMTLIKQAILKEKADHKIDKLRNEIKNLEEEIIDQEKKKRV
jgi:uncharacterized membrane protein